MKRARRRRPDAPRFTLDPATVRRWLGIAAGGCALMVGATLAGPRVLAVVRAHPYFAVREVVVRHHGQLGADELRALAGIDLDTSVWDVDTDVAETRLHTQGWVRSARVWRELPDRVVVQVREYRPIAILAVADESPGLYYLAANGRIFAPVANDEARDLPYVTGLGRADLAGTEAFGPRAVRLALALLRRATRRPALGVVSEVHVDRTAGLTLLPVRPTVAIEIGWGDYDTKLARVAEVLPQWAGREGQVRGVSCIFEDEVIVRTRVTSAPKAGGAPGRANKGKAARAATGA